jgi:aminomethyltransferase
VNVSLTLPRPRLREPGLPRFEPGSERHWVMGGGALVLRLFAGDRVTVTDREGLQPCEIAAFAADGRPDLGALGLDAAAEAPGINRLLAGADGLAQDAVAALRRHGLPARVDKAARSSWPPSAMSPACSMRRAGR